MSGRCQHGVKKISKNGLFNSPNSKINPNGLSAALGLCAAWGSSRVGLDPVFRREKSNPWVGGRGEETPPNLGNRFQLGSRPGKWGAAQGTPNLGKSNVRSPQFRSFRRSRGATRPNSKQGKVQGPFTHFFTQCEKQSHEEKSLRSRVWSSKTHRCPMTQGANDKKIQLSLRSTHVETRSTQARALHTHSPTQPYLP